MGSTLMPVQTGAPIRIALLAAWPVHYQAPLYRLIAADRRIDFTAIFASTVGVRPFDRGFGHATTYDDTVLDGYRSQFLRAADRRSPGGFWALRDPDVVGAVMRGRYDVLWLHGYNSLTHLLALGAQRLRQGAVLIREEQTLLRPRSHARRILKAPLLRALFAGTYGLPIGSESRRWFERYGLPERRLFLAPYATENDRLQFEAAQLASRRPELRSALGVTDDRPIVLCVGRLIKEKQPLAVLEAFETVRRTHKCALVFAGSGALEADVRRLVEERRIPDVFVTGFRAPAELSAIYAAADVFVQFSVSETWGMTVNEALNFRLPMIASDRVGAATDLVIDAVNGIRVRHDDIDGLAGAIGNLVGDDALRHDYGRASREVVAPFSYSAAAAGILDATRAAVGEARWNAAEQAAGRTGARLAMDARA